MKFPFLKSGALRRIAVVCLLATGLPAHGQVKVLKEVLQSQQDAKPSAAENPDDTKARLLQWQKDARESLARMEDPAAANALPQGITATDLEDRRRDAEQSVLTISRYFKTLESAAAVAKSVEAARAKDAEWTGFTEKPPYSILMLDDLRNEQDAVKERLSSYESSLVVFQRTLAEILTETKAAEETSNKLATSTDEASRWRLDASRAKSRSLAARAGLVQGNCEMLTSQIEQAKVEISLLARKIKTARANFQFSAEDLAKIENISSERKTAIRQEIEAIAKRQKTATNARKQVQSALDALVASVPEGTKPPNLELAQFRVEVADDRLDSLQSITEIYENLIQLENLTVSAFQNRKAYLGATSVADRDKALASLAVLRDRLKAWEIFSANEISGAAADLNRLESRAASITAEDPRASLFAEQRALKVEKNALYQRVSQAVKAQRNILDRWVKDYTPDKDEASFYQTVSSFSEKTWEMVKSVWSFEVMKGEITAEVEGQKTTIPTSVTLGVMLRALLFFGIAYGIASKIAKRIQRSIVSRGHIAEAQARTLGNWAMIVVSVFLAIGTLSLLNIPLTIFAFFGGALAIGLGFGSQTLIKNFISGIIVLFERKIRVGDVVDVGGLSGSVTEINTRSSVLRGGDGKETLIPNSYFLENRITNLTLSNRRVRRTLSVGVAYGSNSQKVVTALKECAERHGLVLKEPAPVITLDNFGEKALVFVIYYWTEFNDKTNADVVASDIRFMIEKRFGELEIALAAAEQPIPFRMDQPLQIEWVKKPEA